MLPRKPHRLQFYCRVFSYFRPDHNRILLLLLLSGAATLLGLLQVWPLAILVDAVLTRTPREGWVYEYLVPPGPPWRQILILGLAALSMRLLQELIGMGRSILNLHIAHNGLLRVRCDLFRKLQALHLDFHRRRSQGDTIYRLSNDTASLQAILNVALEVVMAALMLLIMLSIMLTSSLALTAVALLVAPLLLLTNLAFARVLQSYSSAAKERESEFTSVVQRSLSAISLVQAFGREAIEFGRFRSTVSGTNQAWFRLHWQMACYRLCVGLIFGLGGAAIFVYGGHLVYRHQFLGAPGPGMTVGELMVFLTYLSMFYDPLCKLSGAATSLQTAAIGADRVFEVLDQHPTIADDPQTLALPRRPRTLRLANVGFTYPDGTKVLEHINATIEPGQMVAFVGPSGVGKSTLLNLLPRFFDPSQGSLLLDGYDLRQVKLRDLRRHVALVLQESVILPTTVAENIGYGRPDATREQIRAAAEWAGASTFIQQLPEGYDSPIAEGGQNLSGGQRQRIAIARALLTEAPIIVLDEPTSALDTENERLVCETLRKLKGLRTLILVSHRLTTLVDCDQIFVMHQGQVISHGTHQTLLQRRGWYYETAQHQAVLQEGSSRPAAA